MKLRRVGPLLACVVACGDAATPGAHSDAITTVLEIMQTIAADEGPAAFGRIGAIAVARDGRVLVADVLAHQVQVFGPDGTYQFSIGREGSGPGELRSPCCIGLIGDTLYVRDNGNARYSAFVLGAAAARPLRTVRFAHTDANRWAPVTFDADGGIVDVGRRTDVDGTARTFHLHLAADGSVTHEHALPAPPADSIGTFEVQRQVTGGIATFYTYPPFGPDPLIAHGPGGQYVHGIGSRYRLEWRDRTGALLRTVEDMDAQGPALTAEERARGDSTIAQDVQRLGVARGDLDYDIPSHKPPLRMIWFDRDGRLWVELSVTRGAPRRAHVYDKTGARVMDVSWPANVSLTFGGAGTDAIWGIARDSLDVESVVLLAPR